MNKVMKKKIDKLCNVFIDQLISTDSDAGWRNCSQWESMLNEIKSTSGDKDLRMLANTDLLRKKHHDYSEAVASLFRGITKDKYRIAILAHCYYEGKATSEGKIMSEARVAALLGCTARQYRYNKDTAYQRIEQYLVFMMKDPLRKGKVSVMA